MRCSGGGIGIGVVTVCKYLLVYFNVLYLSRIFFAVIVAIMIVVVDVVVV